MQCWKFSDTGYGQIQRWRISALKNLKNEFEKLMPSNDPNQNPFQSMPQPPKPVMAVQPTRTGRPVPRKAKLGFFDCFFEAKEFLDTDYWLFLGLIFVGGFIAGVVPLILIGPIYCGIGLCFIAKEQGQLPSFDLMFKGFEYFSNSLIPVLLYSLGIIVLIPCYMGGMLGAFLSIASGEVALIFLGVFLIFATIFILAIGSSFITYGFLFSTFLVADYQLEGMDAFKVSMDGIKKNFWGLFVVTIATTIIGIGGIMLCYIPFFLMLPLFMAGPFMCYRKIFRGQLSPPRKQMKIEIPD